MKKWCVNTLKPMCNGNGYQMQHTTTGGYSWSASGRRCWWAARHVDE